ncbi:hypothetical protein GCM10023336_62730 [Streptomyces similanensis]|uniref:DUF222 domain-containing protein n=1 Tax=Streptomyces similanensis TaxID=1274988 RepID=A0ABP9LFX6_9ACTN
MHAFGFRECTVEDQAQLAEWLTGELCGADSAGRVRGMAVQRARRLPVHLAPLLGDTAYLVVDGALRRDRRRRLTRFLMREACNERGCPDPETGGLRTTDRVRGVAGLCRPRRASPGAAWPWRAGKGDLLAGLPGHPSPADVHRRQGADGPCGACGETVTLSVRILPTATQRAARRHTADGEQTDRQTGSTDRTTGTASRDTTAPADLP